MIKHGVIAALKHRRRVAVSSASPLQERFVFWPGVTGPFPKTSGSGPLQIVTGTGSGGTGGSGGSLGSGGGGSGGSAGQGYVANTILTEPSDTVATKYQIGLLGSVSTDAGTSYIRAVNASAVETAVATLLGGKHGVTSVAGAGTAGANGPAGLLTGGAAPTVSTARGGDGNNQAAMDALAGPKKDGASGGSGGKYFATRTSAETGRGGQGGYAGGQPTGIAAQGDSGGSDGGGGGNSIAYTHTDGVTGSSSSFKVSGTYTGETVISKKGGGGPGAPTGRIGRKGGLGAFLVRETPGTNLGTGVYETEMLTAPRSFSRYFLGSTEAGWPGPPGGYGLPGSSHTPTFAAYLHRIRTMGWEWNPNPSTTRGAGGLWPAVEKSDGSYDFTWYDARLAAAAAADVQVLENGYGISEFHTAFNTAPYIDAFGTYGGACRTNSLAAYSAVHAAAAARPNAAQVTGIELWNEPSTRPSFFNTSGGMTMGHLIDLNYTCATAWRSVKPGIAVYLPGWIGDGDADDGVRAYLNTPGEVNTTVTGLTMMTSLGAKWASHPYSTANDERVGCGQAIKGFVSTPSGGVLTACEEYLAAGGSNFGWAPTEFGFSSQMIGMTEQAKKWFILKHYLNAWENGADFVNPWQISNIDSTDTVTGQGWYSNTGESVQLAVMTWCAANLYDQSIVSAKVRGDTDGTRIYRRADGITLTINSSLF